MEGNQATAAPAPATQGPETAGEVTESAPSQAETIAEKVRFGDQEMDVESFLKSRKYKAKVDGKDLDIDYDELVRGYGHSSAANARMREAAELKKAAETREKALMDNIYGWKENPTAAFEALEKLGIDVDSISHERVLKKMQLEMMSPEERKVYDMEQELSKYKSREAQESEAKRQQEISELRQNSVTQLENGILDYLQGKPNISPAVVGRAVDAMIAAAEDGKDISIEEAFKHADGWYEKERKMIFDHELRSMLAAGDVPKELADAIRKADMASLRKEPPKRTAPDSNQSKPQSSSQNVDDFFTSMERKFKK
jgi:hypothetical protein